MDQKPEMFDILHENCGLVQDAFSDIYGLEMYGDRVSPIKHLRMSDEFIKTHSNGDRQQIKKIMQQIVDKVRTIEIPYSWDN